LQDIYRSLLNELGDDGEIKNLTFQNLDVLHDSQFQLEDKDLQVRYSPAFGFNFFEASKMAIRSAGELCGVLKLF
jgi:hypothetical protein